MASSGFKPQKPLAAAPRFPRGVLPKASPSPKMAPEQNLSSYPVKKGK